MNCPICQNQKLKRSVFFNVQIDYCPNCLGLWFEQDKLRQAKDEKDKELNWLDIDLWEDKDKLKVTASKRVCPKDGALLFEIGYGDSNIAVDLCDVCKGIWLNREEFEKIIKYLKKRGANEVLENYYKALIKQGIEVFTGPETFREELQDFLTLLKLFNYKFATQHPLITTIILSLPK